MRGLLRNQDYSDIESLSYILSDAVVEFPDAAVALSARHDHADVGLGARVVLQPRVDVNLVREDVIAMIVLQRQNAPLEAESKRQ